MWLHDPVCIGDHKVQISGMVVRLVLQGEFTKEHTSLYAALVDAAIPRGAPYAALVQISGFSGMGPDARRFIASWNSNHNCTHGAIVGSSLLMRGFVALAIRALNLTRGTPIPFVFFPDEAAAETSIEQWLKDQKD